MEDTYENSQYIDRYLNGTLTVEERQAFEQRCERDPDFAEEVRLHVIAVATVLRAARQQRKTEFNAEYDRLMVERQGKSRSLRPYFFMAAAAVVLALLLVWWNGREARPAGLEGLIALHQNDFDISMQQSRQATAPGSERMMAAATAYDASEYELATRLLQALLADSLTAYQVEARFYLGMSHYQQALQGGEAAHYARALIAFAAVPAESAFQPKALWFSALIYLEQKDYAAARLALQAVIDFPGHYRREEAQALLAALPDN